MKLAATPSQLIPPRRTLSTVRFPIWLAVLALGFSVSTTMPSVADIEGQKGNGDGSAADVVGSGQISRATGKAGTGVSLAVPTPGHPVANDRIFRNQTRPAAGRAFVPGIGRGVAIVVDTNFGNRTNSNLTRVPEPGPWPMISLGFFLFFARCRILAPQQ
jgi:hypothetical protein